MSFDHFPNDEFVLMCRNLLPGALINFLPTENDSTRYVRNIPLKNVCSETCLPNFLIFPYCVPPLPSFRKYDNYDDEKA